MLIIKDIHLTHRPVTCLVLLQESDASGDGISRAAGLLIWVVLKIWYDVVDPL
jgi:hypothetical protein